MPVAQYPELAPPQVTVMAFYTGANAQAVETAVTTPLEQAINGVEGMLYMTLVEHEHRRLPDQRHVRHHARSGPRAVDVQNRVNQAIGRMPAEVRTTGITVQKGSTGFVLAVGVYSENGAYDSLFMSNYLDVYVKDALKRVPGVGDVLIFGERKYSMRLWLDPEQARRARLDRGRRGQRAARAERAGCRRQHRRRARPRRADLSDQRSRRRAAARGRASSRTSSSKRASPAAWSAWRDVGRAELGAETYASQLRFQGYRRRRIRR